MSIRELEHVMEKAQRDRDKLVEQRSIIESKLTEMGFVYGDDPLEEELEEIEDELKDLDRFLRILEEPLLLVPCSSVARAAGCTCEMSVVHSTDIDPPEPVISRYCPLHGSESDEDD